MNRTWKLGVRLLMPRYEIGFIAEQIKMIFAWSPETFVRIPVVNGKFYRDILNLDYERMKCKQFPEIGPFVLEEEKDGTKYRYRSPRRPLPIDRSLEIQFDAYQQHQQLNWNPPQQRSGRQLSAPNHNTWHPHQKKHHGYKSKYHSKTIQQDPSQTDYLNQDSRGDYGSYVSPQERSKFDNQYQSSTSSSYPQVQDPGFVPPRQDEQIRNNRVAVDLVDEDDEILDVDEVILAANKPSLLMHMDEINQRIDNSNLEHADKIMPRASLTGHDTERIRGGGYSDISEPNDLKSNHQNSYLYLCDVPLDEWKGKAVYTFVQTASQGSVCRDALLVGFARGCIEVNSHDEEIPVKVEIEAYYLSGMGYFENTKMHQSDSDEVWVVNIDQDCEEARVIAKLHSQKKLPSDYHEELQRASLRNTIPDSNQKEVENDRIRNIQGDQEDECAMLQATLSDDQQVRGKEISTKASSFVDALWLGFDQTTYNYICEEQHFGLKPSFNYRSGCNECSLCSLPLERYLTCTVPAKHNKNGSKPIFPRSLGCSLMSDTALADRSSHFNMNIPGRLGEGKILLLKIARLIPASLKFANEDRNQRVDPLLSYRVFDNGANYATWKGFVAECTCTEMLAQALVMLLASIKRTKLPDWWSRQNAGWSTSYAIMAESCLSTLYLHIYVLDVALSDIISRSLKEKSDSQRKSNESNANQNQRMKRYWERAMTQGYKAFEGNNKDKCYHCNDGGHLLCCELCPNVQHHECCDPKLRTDVKLDYWLCDSCINDIDSYDHDEEFEHYQDEDLSS